MFVYVMTKMPSAIFQKQQSEAYLHWCFVGAQVVLLWRSALITTVTKLWPTHKLNANNDEYTERDTNIVL